MDVSAHLLSETPHEKLCEFHKSSWLLYELTAAKTKITSRHESKVRNQNQGTKWLWSVDNYIHSNMSENLNFQLTTVFHM